MQESHVRSGERLWQGRARIRVIDNDGIIVPKRSDGLDLSSFRLLGYQLFRKLPDFVSDHSDFAFFAPQLHLKHVVMGFWGRRYVASCITQSRIGTHQEYICRRDIFLMMVQMNFSCFLLPNRF